MNYPTSYKPISPFTLPDGVVKDLKDICLELTDVGFKIYIYDKSVSYFNTPHMVMTYHSSSNQFNLSEVQDVVNRISDYMDEKGYFINYTPHDKLHFLTIRFFQKENENMKYLKTFEKFNSNDDKIRILEDLKDICLELTDVGYDVDINIHSVNIDHKRAFFINEISEVLDRIKDYMEEKGYRVIGPSAWMGGHGYKRLNLAWSDSNAGINKFVAVRLVFYKD